jgi:hypothetical protein
VGQRGRAVPGPQPRGGPVTFLVAPLHTLLLFLLVLLLLGEGHGVFDEAQVSHGEAAGPLWLSPAVPVALRDSAQRGRGRA